MPLLEDLDQQGRLRGGVPAEVEQRAALALPAEEDDGGGERPPRCPPGGCLECSVEAVPARSEGDDGARRLGGTPARERAAYCLPIRADHQERGAEGPHLAHSLAQFCEGATRRQPLPVETARLEEFHHPDERSPQSPEQVGQPHLLPEDCRG